MSFNYLFDAIGKSHNNFDDLKNFVTTNDKITENMLLSLIQYENKPIQRPG